MDPSSPPASFKTEDDINFVIMSYDVGSEKPESKIFDAAKRILPGEERFLHVGDDVHKDYYAAKRAGWEGVLLDRGTENRWREDDDDDDDGLIRRIKNLGELTARIG